MNLLTKQEIETWIAAKNTTVLSGNQIDAALHTALDALARLEDAEAAVALVLERACLAVSEQADWPEDEHGRTEQPELFARVINAIRALASPSGREALAALRAELGRLRAIIRVNGLRSGATDTEIAALLYPKVQEEAQ